MKMPAWLERASPGEVGIFLSKTASPRKRGLFVRHLCRNNPQAFPDPRSLAALDDADRYEAGEIDEAACQAAVQAAVLAAEEADARLRAAGHPSASYGAALSALNGARVARDVAAHGYYQQAMADLMRVVGASTCPRSTSRRRAARAIRLLFLEHFGDVRQPVAFAPSWRAGPALALAVGIYAERAFDHMPILADALEEAGCADAHLLHHCRGGGEHARGCWALDLVLGKS